MKEAFIVNGIRTPIGKFKGALSEIRADDLLAHTISELLKRHPNLDPSLIADVIVGCHNQAGEDNRNVARMALLLAGLPVSVPGETVNRLCASGMSAVVQARRAIAVGDGEIFLAGGLEHMTRSPYVISKTTSAFGNDAKMYDSSFGWRFINPKMKQLYGVEAMGETAENLQVMHAISREDQDLFAYRSQMKASTAAKNGRLAKEIASVAIERRKEAPLVVGADEFIRPDTTLAALAKLQPAFRQKGTVTAGNSSGLNDGAAMLLIASEKALQQQNLKPLARIVATQVVGVEPGIMGIGPVEASNRALKKAGLTMNDMDIIEINEAFAAQSLACIRSWGLQDDDERINPNGGAIALGHPLGMSGARLLQTAAIELRERNTKYALCTMCVGLGQGYAVILEKA